MDLPDPGQVHRPATGLRIPSHRDTPAMRLLRALTQAGQQVQRWNEGEAREVGLSPGEFDLVLTLGNTDGLRMCDAARRMLTSAPNLTRVAKLLEQKGLATRTRSADSDREVIVALTAAGEAIFVAAYPRTFQRMRERFESVFDAAEIAQLSALLERVSSAQAGDEARSAASAPESPAA